MTDRPIIFSGPMVRALLDGRKTQTRRLLIRKISLFDGNGWPKEGSYYWDDAWVDDGPSPVGNLGPYLKLPALLDEDAPDDKTVHRIYPRIQPGDRLYVREAWQPRKGYSNWDLIVEYAADKAIIHLQDGDVDVGDWVFPKSAQKGFVPSIHRPRWASRLTLNVTDVRVQRLQDISETDALAEVLQHSESWEVEEGDDMELVEGWSTDNRHSFKHNVGETAKEGFQILWDSLNAKRAPWDSNPWIVAVSFDVEQRNLDQ